ncbi:MAG TPA: NUDIX domain-containing protein [Gemmatimonadales bacterium]|nr:NUDIX domain-containing protein [Gemmatimonadales bacterium]
MTTIGVSLVDVYVLRGTGAGLRCLVLRRGPDGRCPGSWEAVHGHIEPGETPAQAALRELEEETGARPLKMYNLSRMEAFYQHARDQVTLIPVFAAFVADGAEVRLGPEHDRFEWLSPDEARRRFAWPREGRALDDAVALVGRGDAGAVEDVLRVC